MPDRRSRSIQPVFRICGFTVCFRMGTGESVFAILMGILFLGQIPAPWEIIGQRLVVVIGLLYYNYYTGLAEKGEFMSYKVRLRTFEGPFDLLVYLIENAQMNIYDIQISEITGQYLDYIKTMREMDFNVGTGYGACGNSD